MAPATAPGVASRQQADEAGLDGEAMRQDGLWEGGFLPKALLEPEDQRRASLQRDADAGSAVARHGGAAAGGVAPELPEPPDGWTKRRWSKEAKG